MAQNTVYQLNADRIAALTGGPQPINTNTAGNLAQSYIAIPWVQGVTTQATYAAGVGTTTVDPTQGVVQVCQVGYGTTVIQPTSLPYGQLIMKFTNPPTGTNTVQFGTGFRYDKTKGQAITAPANTDFIVGFQNFDGSFLGGVPGGTAYAGQATVYAGSVTGSFGGGFCEIFRTTQV